MNEQRNEETKLYSIRWFIIFLIGFVAIVSRTLRSSFGVVNDVYVSYFNVSYVIVDWFTLIMLPGSVIFCVLFFLLSSFGKSISTSKLAILMSGCLSFTCICSIIAYVHTKLYPVMLVGNFVLGVVIAALDPVTASYAIDWFPEHQIGIALASKEIGACTGSLFGFIIPSNLLLVPNKQLNSTNVTGWPLTTQPNSNQNWFSKNQIQLIVFSSVLLTIAALITICFAIFMKKKPPLPPTKAQAKVRLQLEEQSTLSSFDWNQLTKLLKLLKLVMLSKVFLQVIFILSAAVGGCSTFLKVFMGEILRKLFIELGYQNKYNALSGLALLCYVIGTILGSVLSGKLVDNFKNYHQQISIALASGTLSMIFILLGYYFNITALVFVFHVIFGICLGYLSTPCYEIIFQHFYPADSGILSLMIRISYSLATLILGESPRLILIWFPGGIAVIVYIIIFYLLSFVMSLFLKPNYNRLAANNNSEISTRAEEEAPLLSDSIKQN